MVWRRVYHRRARLPVEAGDRPHENSTGRVPSQQAEAVHPVGRPVSSVAAELWGRKPRAEQPRHVSRAIRGHRPAGSGRFPWLAAGGAILAGAWRRPRRSAGKPRWWYLARPARPGQNSSARLLASVCLSGPDRFVDGIRASRLAATGSPSCHYGWQFETSPMFSSVFRQVWKPVPRKARPACRPSAAAR
jgi:hypothetical protein